MKRREGFISNSSSTSFCMFGAELHDKSVGDEDDEKGGLSDFLWKNYERASSSKKTRVRTWSHPGGGLYVGVPLRTIKDDETGSEFKRNAKEELLGILREAGYSEEEISGLNFAILEEAWHD